jgi:L-threonylcarbamoyladenylate synthase
MRPAAQRGKPVRPAQGIDVAAAMPTQLIEAGAAATRLAADALGAGALVAFPTETVYGLGADAANGEAIARLYEAKGRPRFNPLIVHVPSEAAARAVARLDAAAGRLAAAFWPGPLTLVLPRAPGCPVAELATAGLDSIAVRVPAHPVARDILAAFGGAVVAPSANRSGHVSPTTAQHVLADLGGRIALIVDGGPAPLGLESTIVSCLGPPSLLRPGALAREEIARVVSLAADAAAAPAAGSAPLAPGQLGSHYAPRARLRLDAAGPAPGEALLAFGALPAGAAAAVAVRNLSAQGDLIEAAANLFSHLRALDACGAAVIAVMPVPREGLGEAINDRLERAAAPR